VKDFAASRISLDSILARHQGYSAHLNASTSENAPRSITASLRVPANELATTLAELKSLGHVETESQSGEEVTQQHADLVARLKNSRETERRLQAILLQRTGKISDVLAVEQEIARVRGEIEQMEAEQKSLEHRVDFATIELRLSEEYKARLNNSSPSASTRIHNSLVAGYKNAAETLLGFVLFFAESGPTLLIWLAILLVPALLLVRRYRRAAAAF
jgi:chromosome segregation ATPase